MMNRQTNKQSSFQLLNIENMVAQDHFLRKLDAAISFDFVYDIVEPLYSTKGRRSIDPVVLVKMLLLGYLYGIDSERKLEENVNYNIAFRWYLGFNLTDTVPDHSTFSQNRRRRFKGQEVFRKIFEQIVWKCYEAGLVKGERVVMDSTHIKANADNLNSVPVEVIRTPKAYWDDLNQTELNPESIVKSKNPDDPDAGYMNRTNKPKGFHYLAHQCSDADTGIILRVSVTGGDVQDCERCVDEYKYLKEVMKLPVKAAGLDGGYDTIAIHYGLTRLGIKAFIRPCRRGVKKRTKWLSRKDFIWDSLNNKYICPNNKELKYSCMTYPKASSPMLIYASKSEDCKNCQYRIKCFAANKKHREIGRRIFLEYQEAGRARIGKYLYKYILERRQIVCEGNFALQKRCHNLRFTRFRGLENVSMQCLLSATALNLKRLVKYGNIPETPDIMTAKAAIISGVLLFMRLNFAECAGSSFKICFCQQTHSVWKLAAAGYKGCTKSYNPYINF